MLLVTLHGLLSCLISLFSFSFILCKTYSEKPMQNNLILHTEGVTKCIPTFQEHRCLHGPVDRIIESKGKKGVGGLAGTLA